MIPHPMPTPPFYTGSLQLSAYNCHVTLDNVRLWEYHESWQDRQADGSVIHHKGLKRWRGTARLAGLIPGLYDVLGELCVVTLPDGRTGEAYATGHMEDSAWIIDLQGDGPVPA